MPISPTSCIPYIYFHTISPCSVRISWREDMVHQIFFENNYAELIITLFLFFIHEGEFSRDWRMKLVSEIPWKTVHFQNGYFEISLLKKDSWHRLERDVIFWNGCCLDIAKTLMTWNEAIDLGSEHVTEAGYKIFYNFSLLESGNFLELSTCTEKWLVLISFRKPSTFFQ